MSRNRTRKDELKYSCFTLLPPKLRTGLATLVAGLAIACARGSEPADFNDPLTGPVSPPLSIPFEKYALTPAGLLRKDSESGTENGLERPLVKTVSGDYLSRDFVFEIDVTIPADHGDIAFVGFGSARSWLEGDNEPTDAFVFRIHNLPGTPYYGIDLALADPDGGRGYRNRYRVFERIGDYTPGKPMRFQISHKAGVVTLAIPALPGASMSFSRDQYDGLFDASAAHLFFGNSSEGTTFTNASVRKP